MIKKYAKKGENERKIWHCSYRMFYYIFTSWIACRDCETGNINLKNVKKKRGKKKKKEERRKRN